VNTTSGSKIFRPHAASGSVEQEGDEASERFEPEPDRLMASTGRSRAAPVPGPVELDTQRLSVTSGPRYNFTQSISAGLIWAIATTGLKTRSLPADHDCVHGSSASKIRRSRVPGALRSALRAGLVTILLGFASCDRPASAFEGNRAFGCSGSNATSAQGSRHGRPRYLLRLLLKTLQATHPRSSRHFFYDSPILNSRVRS